MAFVLTSEICSAYVHRFFVHLCMCLMGCHVPRRYLLSDDANINTGASADNHYWPRDDESQVSYSSYRDPYIRRYCFSCTLLTRWYSTLTKEKIVADPKTWMDTVPMVVVWMTAARSSFHMLRYYSECEIILPWLFFVSRPWSVWRFLCWFSVKKSFLLFFTRKTTACALT